MKLPKDRKSRIRWLLVIVAAVAAYLAYRNLVPDFDPQKLLEDVSRSLGEWTYALVAVFAFLETGAFVGLVAPGETAVVLAGAVAGQGETSILLTIALVWLAAFLGDSVSYLLGVKLGRGFVVEHGSRIRVTPERLAKVEEYFDRHGGKTILIGRFIGLVRALAPFIAGSSGMRYSAMAPFSVLGTGIWATFFSLLGYYASQNIDIVLKASERGLLYFGTLVAIVVGAIVAVRFLRVPENRARTVRAMEEQRLLRPLVAQGRRLRPQRRFVWNRLTPGGLGLELTVPLAFLAVGGFVFVAYAILLGEQPGPTGGDVTAANIAADLRAGWLTSVEKAITALGSGVALLVVSGVAAVGFGIRRHFAELGILIGAVAMMFLLVPEAKELIDRPRPSGELIDVGGQAYPSGHATYSVLYAWLALALTVRLRPTWSGGTALLVAGILLAAAIGLSRVYLGVHYLSDVSGGWGFGVCAFAIATGVSVIVVHVRKNQHDGA